jgi:hypothetical protein
LIADSYRIQTFSIGAVMEGLTVRFRITNPKRSLEAFGYLPSKHPVKSAGYSPEGAFP